MTSDEAALLAEANRVNYRLRSIFFYRKLKEYSTLGLPSTVAKLYPIERLYDWAERAEWGISAEAFSYVAGHAHFHLIQIFCHPKLLREYPTLIAYYRNIAALSQKGVGYLTGVDAKKYETDLENKRQLPFEEALKLAHVFNEHVCLILDASIQTLDESEIQGILLASTGAQIDGAWRNAIGAEAEKVVQRFLVKEARDHGALAAFIPRAGAVETYNPDKDDEQMGAIEGYRGIMLTNGTSMLFSSDPDISLLNPSGMTMGVLEVKGGADPAGSLERYGAAKKSFEQALRITPTVETILVASCITGETQTRIKEDPSIHKFYNLTELLSPGAQAYERFIGHVFALLGVSM